MVEERLIFSPVRLRRESEAALGRRLELFERYSGSKVIRIRWDSDAKQARIETEGER